MKRCILHKLPFLILLFVAFGASARERRADPLAEVDTAIHVGEVVIRSSSVKQRLPLSQSPVAASLLLQEQIERLQLSAPKEISCIVPNLYAPDYGSRMTSSIYVRGLGARIDQPVVGLNVDNVPMMNKDAYDLEVADIERLEVLRGPQSTLYGRNTMGGVINLRTLSPLNYQGVRILGEYGTGNSYKLRLSSYNRLNQLGIGVSAHFGGSDGLFTNEYTGKKCDHETGGGARFKVEWERDRWFVGNTFAAAYLEQGGYPYRSVEGGNIAYNDPCGYDRATLTEAFTLRYTAPSLVVESITSYQYLDDRMILDQDFRPESYFTLEQIRQEHALTEEVVVRSATTKRYQWLVGAFGFWKGGRMQAPVTFKPDGIQNLILGNIPEGIEVEFPDEFPLDSNFDQQTFGAALYHESTLKLGHWLLTAGLRLDMEWASLDYLSATHHPCRVNTTTIAPFELAGALKNRFVEMLPKLSVLHRFGNHRLSNIYLSAAKGYKAGGFNTQMFSEVLQNSLMKQMGISFNRQFDPAEVVSYDPEWSWNYELGGRLHLAKGDLQLDWALFFIDCHDQQLTVFPPGQTTGRMMTNAGRTHSLGGELSLRARPTRHLLLSASYGYTHATFREYRNGEADYAGNRVPYAPEHTLAARIDYTFEIGRRWLERIIPSLDLRGAGRIAWNEENTLWQDFYMLPGLSLRFEHRNYTLDLWCRNLSDTRYDLFYFKSVGREFMQQGRPRTFGVTISANF